MQNDWLVFLCTWLLDSQPHLVFPHCIVRPAICTSLLHWEASMVETFIEASSRCRYISSTPHWFILMISFRPILAFFEIAVEIVFLHRQASSFQIDTSRYADSRNFCTTWVRPKEFQGQCDSLILYTLYWLIFSIFCFHIFSSLLRQIHFRISLLLHLYFLSARPH